MQAKDTHTETLEPVNAIVGLNMDQLDALLDGPVDDDLLNEVAKDVAIIERQNEVLARVEAERPSIQPAEGDEPATDPDAVSAIDKTATATPKKGKGTRKKAEPKVKEPKEPKPERLYYHSASKSAVLMSKLGGDAGVLNLELADVLLSPDDQKAKHEALLAAIDSEAAKKVGEKAVMVLTGKSASQEVLKRAFTVLARDGYLTSGDKGNLQVNLLSKPYSLGTSRSQANQVFSLFPMLKITVKDGKGRQVPNPQSTILAATLRELGLTLKAAE